MRLTRTRAPGGAQTNRRADKRRLKRGASALALTALVAGLGVPPVAQASQQTAASADVTGCPGKRAIFLSGGRGSSSRAADIAGIHQLGNNLTRDGVLPPDGQRNMQYDDDVVGAAREYKDACPNGNLILVGHSYGGDTAIETAQTLGESGIRVALLVQMESFGNYDDVLPASVDRGVNLYSTAYTFPVDGETDVAGSLNIGIDGSDHENIDDPVGESNQGGFEHLNAHQITTNEVRAIP
jgi:pimeloyl-ACP methyl ester carboxylesterase